MPADILTFTSAEVSGWVGQHIWPLFRVSGFFMVVPLIGTRLVPIRIRMGLSFLVTMLIVPLIPPVPNVDALSLASIPIIAQQIFIGGVLGFSLMLLMQLFVVAGQFISMQMGLGFASMVDPTNGISVPVLSQIFLIGVTLMFFLMNGHLVMIETFVESFRAWPISTQFFSDGGFSPNAIWAVIHRISWLFSSALLIALPAVSAVFIVNVAFGIMTRAAPQMNIFSLGFPISLMFGLFIVWVSMADLLPQFQRLSQNAFLFLRTVQGL